MQLVSMCVSANTIDYQLSLYIKYVGFVDSVDWYSSWWDRARRDLLVLLWIRLWEALLWGWSANILQGVIVEHFLNKSSLVSDELTSVCSVSSFAGKRIWPSSTSIIWAFSLPLCIVAILLEWYGPGTIIILQKVTYMFCWLPRVWCGWGCQFCPMQKHTDLPRVLSKHLGLLVALCFSTESWKNSLYVLWQEHSCMQN